MIYWFTGQPGAGKTTVASALKSALESRGLKVIHLDADDWRKTCGNQDYTELGRRRNIITAQHAAELHSKSGKVVLCSFVSPYKDLRESLKQRADVIEVYMHTSQKRGREHFHVKDYQAPTEYFVEINTDSVSVRDAVNWLIEMAYEK